MKILAVSDTESKRFFEHYRPGALDSFDLLDDIENNLGIATCPVNWPVGSGKAFKGIYDRNSRGIVTYSDTMKGTKEGKETIVDISDRDAVLKVTGEEALQGMYHAPHTDLYVHKQDGQGRAGQL